MSVNDVKGPKWTKCYLLSTQSQKRGGLMKMRQTSLMELELYCGKCLKNANWRTRGPVGESSNKSATQTQTTVRLKTISNVESVKHGEPRKLLANHRPGRRSRSSPSFEPPV
uniref:Uncharacterized protein n=1 Tax=Solanum tuberosum TaxID=4113 RepID=M1DW97_SOLTU